MNLHEKLKTRLGRKVFAARSAMEYPADSQLRMLSCVRNQQWLIRPDRLHGFAFAALEASERAGKAESYLSQFYDLRQPMNLDGDGIAHIQVRGALMDSAPPIFEKVGIATRYSTISAETSAAVKAGAKGIVYHIDSPGGTVAGVIEAGHAMKHAGVPTAAFCSGLACSAAYWLASSCSSIVATPSASVGNIGAIISWADCDKLWEEMGITFKALVSEGADLKSTFHLEPNEDQLAFLQAEIDAAGAQFRAHVQAGRSKLDAEVWRAGWYSGERAKALGLIDAIATAPPAASSFMTTKPTTTKPAAAAKPAPAPRPASAQEIAAALADEQEKRAAAAKVKTRAEFNAMNHKERGEFFKNGGKLVD